MPNLPVFDAWREALHASLEAETRLLRAQLDACADRAPAPSPEMIRTTRMLQARAQALFEAAMAEVQAAARALGSGWH